MRTDADLLRDDFGGFYERHVTAVTAYVARRTPRADLTLDLVAETFARALVHRHGYQPRRGPAAAWLLGIANHLLTDAARQGTVAATARVRLGMAPIALDDEQLARVGARGRTPFADALAPLTASQREAVLRRVLGEPDYPALAESVGGSEQLVRSRARRGAVTDPFELLRDRLLEASGALPARRRRPAPIVLVAVALVLAAGAVAAVIALTGDDASPKPPAPTATPRAPRSGTGTAPAPTATPRARGAPRAPTPPGATIPAPADYTIELIPDLLAGRTGWCLNVALRTGSAGQSCGPAGPPGTNLIAGGRVVGVAGKFFVVVDRRVAAVRLADGRRLVPRRDPALPPAWRIADGESAPGGFTLLDANGQVLTSRTPGGRGALPARRVSPRRPPRTRCAIRARRMPGLRATSARMVRTIPEQPADVVRPSFLSCASTVYSVNGQRFRASVLLDARDPSAEAAPLPTAHASLSARRAGRGWLVVSGGSPAERAQVLSALRVGRR